MVLLLEVLEEQAVQLKSEVQVEQEALLLEVSEEQVVR